MTQSDRSTGGSSSFLADCSPTEVVCRQYGATGCPTSEVIVDFPQMLNLSSADFGTCLELGSVSEGHSSVVTCNSDMAINDYIVVVALGLNVNPVDSTGPPDSSTLCNNAVTFPVSVADPGSVSESMTPAQDPGRW